MSPQRVRTIFKSPWFRASVSVGLIVALCFSLDMTEFRAQLARVSLLTVLALVAIDLILRLMSAHRWYVLYRVTNPSASLPEMTRITFVSSFLGQALPGVIGVEALRLYSLARSASDWPGAVSSVVVDRAVGLISLGLLVIVGSWFGPPQLSKIILIPVLVALGILLLIAVSTFVPAARRIVESVFPTAVIEKLRHWIDNFYSCIDSFRGRPWILGYALLLAILFQLGRVLLFFAAALLIGETPEFVYFVAFVPVVMFASLMPISIGGLGVREVGLVFLFALFDVMSKADSLTIALLVFLSGLLSTLPGGWLYVKRRRSIDEAISRAS
jgi:glycosyltransferase 2 family protein